MSTSQLDELLGIRDRAMRLADDLAAEAGRGGRGGGVIRPLCDRTLDLAVEVIFGEGSELAAQAEELFQTVKARADAFHERAAASQVVSLPTTPTKTSTRTKRVKVSNHVVLDDKPGFDPNFDPWTMLFYPISTGGLERYQHVALILNLLGSDASILEWMADRWSMPLETLRAAQETAAKRIQDEYQPVDVLVQLSRVVRIYLIRAAEPEIVFEAGAVVVGGRRVELSDRELRVLQACYTAEQRLLTKKDLTGLGVDRLTVFKSRLLAKFPKAGVLLHLRNERDSLQMLAVSIASQRRKSSCAT